MYTWLLRSSLTEESPYLKERGRGEGGEGREERGGRRGEGGEGREEREG